MKRVWIVCKGPVCSWQNLDSCCWFLFRINICAKDLWALRKNLPFTAALPDTLHRSLWVRALFSEIARTTSHNISCLLMNKRYALYPSFPSCVGPCPWIASEIRDVSMSLNGHCLKPRLLLCRMFIVCLVAGTEKAWKSIIPVRRTWLGRFQLRLPTSTWAGNLREFRCWCLKMEGMTVSE